MSIFKKIKTYCQYVNVPAGQPTFAATRMGTPLHVVENYIIMFDNDHTPVKCWLVTDKGECVENVYPLTIIFHSPITQAEYKHVRSYGKIWNTFTPQYFDDWCIRNKVEVKD